MSPDRSGGKDEGEEQPSADETQEYELGDDFTEDDHGVDEELRMTSTSRQRTPDDEEPDDEDLDERTSRATKKMTSTRTTRSSSTSSRPRRRSGMAWRPPRPRGRRRRPWSSSAGDRVKQAGSSITSSFERVGHAAGPKITSGFKAVRRHVRFPDVAALPDRLPGDHRLDRGRHLGEPDPLPLGHRQRAQARQHPQWGAAVPEDAGQRRRRRSSSSDRTSGTSRSAESTGSPTPPCCSDSIRTGTRSPCSPCRET